MCTTTGEHPLPTEKLAILGGHTGVLEESITWAQCENITPEFTHRGSLGIYYVKHKTTSRVTYRPRQNVVVMAVFRQPLTLTRCPRESPPPIFWARYTGQMGYTMCYQGYPAVQECAIFRHGTIGGN